MLTGILLTLAAACCFECSYVLQALEVRAAAPMARASVGALRELAARPRWLTSIALGLAGFGLQVLALRHVPLSLVQPLLATGLLGLLAFSATVLGEPVGRREVGAVAAIVAGVSLIALADPQRSDGGATSAAFVVVTVALALLALSAFARRRPGAGGLLGGAIAADALAALAAAQAAHALPAVRRPQPGARWRPPAASPPSRPRAPSCNVGAPLAWPRSCWRARSRCPSPSRRWRSASAGAARRCSSVASRSSSPAARCSPRHPASAGWRSATASTRSAAAGRSQTWGPSRGAAIASISAYASCERFFATATMPSSW